MNPLENELQYPLGDTLPDFGTALDIQPGLRWVRMPLPFALDHINLWLLRDHFNGRDGWTIIDCGVANAEIKKYWEQVFENALEGLPVLRVIVTHMHPDHVGLAAWLCRRFDVPLFMTMAEYTTARLLSSGVMGGDVNGGDRAAEYFREHGISDPAALDKVRGRNAYYTTLVPEVPPEFARII